MIIDVLKSDEMDRVMALIDTTGKVSGDGSVR